MEGVLEGPTVVRFCGRTCKLTLEQEIVSVSANSPTESAARCCGLLEGSASVTISKEEVVGAETTSYSAFRIHYAEKAPTKSPTKQTEYLLKKTRDIDCGQGGVAPILIQRIRNWALNDDRNETERRVLFLINPKSGKGTARKVFDNKIAPMIRNVFGWKIDKQMTEHNGHATELIMEHDLTAYSAICIAGGDGTIHEALQGFLRRADWETCLNIPLVPFPLGSGNALAASLGLNRLDTILFAISKGRTQTMDILSIDQNRRRLYSFLGIMYGALSSLDIESEKLRWMGDIRFTLGALREIVRLRSFKIKFAYLPYEDVGPPIETEGGLAGYPSPSDAAQPSRNNYEHEGHHSHMPSLQPGMIDTEIKEWFSKCEEDGIGPCGWKMHHDFETRLMALLNLPHIAKKSHFMPSAEVGDGAMHLILTPTEASTRCNLLKLFLKSSKGEHISLETVQTMKIKAFMFSPEQTCPLTVDGEQVPSESISVEILPGLLKTITVPLLPPRS